MKSNVNVGKTVKFSKLALSFLAVLTLCFPERASAAKEVFQRTKPHVNIGTIGHTDSSRTTLLAALAETFHRPLLYKQFPWDDPGGTGHLRVEALYTKIRNDLRNFSVHWHYDNVLDPHIPKAIITAAVPQDGALLVISANAGISEQVREHVLLARQVGVPELVVFLDEIDQVTSPDALGRLRSEIRDVLNEAGYDGNNAPIIQGSSLQALRGDPAGQYALAELLDALEATVPQPLKKADKPFLMTVDQVNDSASGEVIVIGGIKSGRVQIGDEVEIVGIVDTVQKAKVFSFVIAEDVEGEDQDDRIGLLLRGISRDQVFPGQVVAEPGLVQPAVQFQALIYVLLPDEGGTSAPFFKGYRPQFYMRTHDVTGEVQIPSDLASGDAGLVEVMLDFPMALMPGQRFPIRDGGRTVGAGVVVEVVTGGR